MRTFDKETRNTKLIFIESRYLERRTSWKIKWTFVELDKYGDTGLCSLSGCYISTFIIGSELSCSLAANEPLLGSPFSLNRPLCYIKF